MRPYFWLFLGLGAVNSILVQDAASSKRLELIQKDIGFFPGNQLPDQDHVAQKDLESFNKDAHVNKQLARSNLVEEEEASAEENSLLKPLGKKETRIEWQLCKGIIIDNKCYQFFRGPMTASDAEFYCQDHFPNGHLASVTSRLVHDNMMLLMDKNGGRTRTWIGGLRYLNTGRFIWLDGAQWKYADWLPGEPNNTAGVENCVELLSNSKFNDMPCWDLRAYICSYPIQ